MYRVNAFDWEAEFPEIMGRGGFDAVIGNPPYIRLEWISTCQLRKYWQFKIRSCVRKLGYILRL